MNLILILKTNLFYSIVWVHLIYQIIKHIYSSDIVQSWLVIYESWSDSEKVLKKCAENFEQIHFDLWLMVRQSLFGANFLFWHEKAFCVFLQEWYFANALKVDMNHILCKHPLRKIQMYLISLEICNFMSHVKNIQPKQMDFLFSIYNNEVQPK